MKKLLYTVVAVASSFAFASPALATYFWPMPVGGVNVENEHTFVANTVTTKADTGDNFVLFGGSVKTGPAMAVADVQNVVNYTEVGTCGLCLSGKVDVENEHTTVLNHVTTKADTGDNMVTGSMFGGFFGPKIYTGAAFASSAVMNQVNTTIVGDYVQE